MKLTFLSPQRIIFEEGCSSHLGTYIKNIGQRPLILTGGNSLIENGYFKKIINSFSETGIEFIEYNGITGEPTCQLVDKVTEYAVKTKADSIIAIGGGSVIDTGKAAAALAVNEPGVENYLEGVGKGYKLKHSPLPFVAVPTTSGAGAEATKNATITDKEKKYKKSFRDERMLAKLIVVDPILTMSLPQYETACGGMDAVCQLIEVMVTKKKNWFTTALAQYFIPKALKALPEAYHHPKDLKAREIMSAASLTSGIALANSGLGAVHGFASGIGGMFNIPHGLICAILLPGVCEMNSKRQPELYRNLASLITFDGDSNIYEFTNTLYALNDELGIPPNFKSFGIPVNQAKEIVERSQGTSMSANPVDFSDKEWIEFIKKYLG